MALFSLTVLEILIEIIKLTYGFGHTEKLYSVNFYYFSAFERTEKLFEAFTCVPL
jgi:hypothetical protein